MKRIACLVTNDLSQDQRMNRICSALATNGYEVTLIGRKRKKSFPLSPNVFHKKRLNCWFQQGFLFYAEYNIRLFFHLIFSPYDIINANDLDTILPAILVAKLRGKKVVYDAHEYFTEQEELVARPRIKSIWKTIEKWSIPRVDAAYTVSDGYANLFFNEYEVPFLVVKNATVLKEFGPCSPTQKYILYQGAVNHGRGLPELIEAMQKVDCMLYICGVGDILENLKIQVKAQNLEEKVKFWGFIEPEKLIEFTQNAHIGLTLFAKGGLSHWQNAHIGLTLFAKGGLSHWYSLANRFFDYMHAGIPQLAMNYPEYSAFNKNHEIAVLINDIQPNSIAEGLRQLLSDNQLYARLSKNALNAREHENWQAQESVLLSVYESL